MTNPVEKNDNSPAFKKTRITAYIRDEMIKKAHETSGLNEAAIQLIDDRAALVEDIRVAALEQSGLDDESISMLERATEKNYPKGCHARDFMKIEMYGVCNSRFNVNLCGMDIYVWLDGREFGYSDVNAKKTHLTDRVLEEIKEDKRHTPISRVNINNAAFTDRLIKIDNEADRIENKRTELEATLRTAIKKFGTVESMVDQWPQSEELLPAELRPSTALALSMDDLNAVCGIPTGKAE